MLRFVACGLSDRLELLPRTASRVISTAFLVSFTSTLSSLIPFTLLSQHSLASWSLHWLHTPVLTSSSPSTGTQKQPWTVERATTELPRADEKTNGNAAPAAGCAPGGGGADGELQEERDYMCGLGSCSPRIMQRLATPRMFFVVYSLMGVLQVIPPSSRHSLY